MASDEKQAGIDDLEKLLGSKTVVGDPIQLDGHTIVPLLSIGVGFGAGSGNGGDAKGSGAGRGFGGGGGIKPVALIISNKEGVRVERLVGATATTLEGLATMIGKMRGASKERENL